MKKIGIIGANSYIARNIVHILKHKYPEVIYQLYDITENHVDLDLSYKKINILDKKSIKNIDFDCDVLFLFAGKTGTINGFTDYESYININELGLLNLLDAYREKKSTAKIVFPSTRLVYKGKNQPLHEEDEKEFKTPYAMTKFACEQYLEQFCNMFSIKYCIFRICVPYGSLIAEASSYGTAEFMLKKAMSGENITLYGDGNGRRTFIYMGDLCNILLQGAENPLCLNDVYNIGGEDYSLKEIAYYLCQKYHVSIEYIEWPEMAKKIESGSTVFSDKKLQSILNYKLSMSFANWCSIQ